MAAGETDTASVTERKPAARIAAGETDTASVTERKPAARIAATDSATASNPPARIATVETRAPTAIGCEPPGRVASVETDTASVTERKPAAAIAASETDAASVTERKPAARIAASGSTPFRGITEPSPDTNGAGTKLGTAVKGVQVVVAPSTAAKPSQPPSANGASALASLVDKVLNGYAAPKSERDVKNEASLGSSAPISKIATTVGAMQDEDDNWDFGDTTEPSVASVESQALPPGEPDLAAEPSLDGNLTDSVTANPGAREEIPPPPLQGPAPVVPWASELPTGSSAASAAEDAAQDSDEDAELMALIAAAKARADDVPPPPPPHPASIAPTTSEPPAAPRVESTQDES